MNGIIFRFDLPASFFKLRYLADIVLPNSTVKLGSTHFITGKKLLWSLTLGLGFILIQIFHNFRSACISLQKNFDKYELVLHTVLFELFADYLSVFTITILFCFFPPFFRMIGQCCWDSIQVTFTGINQSSYYRKYPEQLKCMMSEFNDEKSIRHFKMCTNIISTFLVYYSILYDNNDTEWDIRKYHKIT